MTGLIETALASTNYSSFRAKKKRKIMCNPVDTKFPNISKWCTMRYKLHGCVSIMYVLYLTIKLLKRIRSDNVGIIDIRFQRKLYSDYLRFCASCLSIWYGPFLDVFISYLTSKRSRHKFSILHTARHCRYTHVNESDR